MRRKIDWTDENRIMIFALPTCVAAQNLGLHPESIRRAKRRFLQKSEAALFDSQTHLENTPEVQIDSIIPQEIPAITEAQSKPKTKPTFQQILRRFLNLTDGQKETAIKIFQESPMSAYRYCKSLQEWRTKKGNEPTNIRYNRRRKTSY